MLRPMSRPSARLDKRKRRRRKQRGRLPLVKEDDHVSASERWTAVFSSPKANLGLRIVVTVLGTLFVGLGIALAKHSSTGTSPISTFPAVCTEIAAQHGFGWLTMGMLTFAFNALYFVLEVALMRREFGAVQILQIPLFILLSASVDVWLGIVSQVQLPCYPCQLLCLACSIVCLGLGVHLCVRSNIIMTPGDATPVVIAYKTHWPFNRVKVCWDVSLMCGAALVSLLCLGQLVHVREGTIISALLVGNMVKAWSNLFENVSWLLPAAPKDYVAPLIPHKLSSPDKD